MKVVFSEYRTKNWKSVRNRIIERDGRKCAHCGRSEDEVKLQVHHLHYEEGKKAWEYPDEYLITLCQHCHAEEHGRVMPTSGWEYIGSDDLEEPIGECEYCGNEIRFEHTIFHPDWGYMIVGCNCADKLTETSEMRAYEAKRKKLASKLRTFMKSPRWRHRKNGYFIDLDCYNIEIWDNNGYYTLKLSFPLYNEMEERTEWLNLLRENIKGKLVDVKLYAFRLITDGVFSKIINDRRQSTKRTYYY